MVIAATHLAVKNNESNESNATHALTNFGYSVASTYKKYLLYSGEKSLKIILSALRESSHLRSRTAFHTLHNLHALSQVELVTVAGPSVAKCPISYGPTKLHTQYVRCPVNKSLWSAGALAGRDNGS